MERWIFLMVLVFSLLAFGGWIVSARGGTIIPVSDAEVVKSLSFYNWVVKADAISSAGGGSSFALGFTGTKRVALQVDTTALAKVAPSRYPVVAWSVNDGAQQTHQLAPGEKEIILATDAETPKIDFYLMGFCPFENRYNGERPINSVRITGFQVDTGGRATALPRPKKIWLSIGDSIMSGDAAREKGNQGRPADDAWAVTNDARASYGYLLSQHFGYNESRLAYGGYNYSGGLAGIPALSILIDQITEKVSRLSDGVLSPSPDVVLINLGENGIPTQDCVVESLAKVRQRIGSAARIIVMVPVSGRGEAEVTAAVAAYRESNHDGAIALVNIGKIPYETADGQHPTAAGHRSIYEAALPEFEKLLR